MIMNDKIFLCKISAWWAAGLGRGNHVLLLHERLSLHRYQSQLDWVRFQIFSWLFHNTHRFQLTKEKLVTVIHTHTFAVFGSFDI